MAGVKGNRVESKATIQVYKCPSCNGALRFDPHGKALSCIWCGNTYDVTSLQVMQVKPTLRGYECPECGAHLMTEEFVAADTCPYCGNNEIAPRRFEGAFEPDLLIPFSVTKRQAIKSYEDSVAQRRYLPDDYANEAKVVSTQGVYVPFWMQSGTVDFDYTYIAIRKEGKMSYTYNHHRIGTYEFARVPADGSERMPDDVMDSIEPYDYTALTPFDAGYLPGFMAERYTVASDEVNQRVNRRVANSACSAAMKTVDGKYQYLYPDYDRFHATVGRSHVELALLPAWLIVVSYKGEKYTVGINGQTGKVAVNLPIDEGKRRMAALGESLKSAGYVLSIYLAFALLIFVIGVGTVGVDGMLERVGSFFSGELWSRLDWKGALALGAFVVALLFFLLGPVIQAFMRGNRKVMKSMHNVKVATEADDFDADGLRITVSEMGQGPLS